MAAQSQVAAAYVAIRAMTDLLAQDFARGRQIAMAGVGLITDAVGKLMIKGFAGIFGVLGSVFTLQLGGLVNTAGGIAEGALGKLGAFVGGAIRVAGGFAAVLTGVIGGLAAGAVGLLGSALSVIPLGIGSLLSGVANVAAGLLATVAGMVSGFVSSVAGTLGRVAGMVGEAAGSVVGRLAGLAASVLDSVLGPIQRALASNPLDFGRWVQGAIGMEINVARLNAIFQRFGETSGYTAAQLQVMARNMAANRELFSTGDAFRAMGELARFAPQLRGDLVELTTRVLPGLAAMMNGDLPDAARVLAMAMEHPERAFRSMRAAGISFSLAQQAALREAAHAASQTGDMAEVQAAILGHVAAAVRGQAAAMADTTQGQLNRLRNSWDDMGRSIGRALLPVVRLIADFMVPLIEGFSSGIVSFVRDAAGGVRSFTEVASQWIRENRATIVQWGAEAAAIVRAVAVAIRDVFVWLGSAVAGLFGGMDVSAAGLADGVTGALRVIRTAAENLPLTFQIVVGNIRGFFTQLFVFLKGQWEVLTEIIALKFQAMLEKMKAFVYRSAILSALVFGELNVPTREFRAGAADEEAARLNRRIRTITEYNASQDNFADAGRSPAVAAIRENTAALEADFRARMSDGGPYGRFVAAAIARATGAATGAYVPLPVGGPANVALPAGAQPKLETVGLAELYKSIQKDLGGGSEQLRLMGANLDALRDNGGVLRDMRDGINRLGERPAVFG